MKPRKPDRIAKPRGEALNLTPEEIAKAAEIGPGDIAAARAHFKRLAPKKFKNLLDARKYE